MNIIKKQNQNMIQLLKITAQEIIDNAEKIINGDDDNILNIKLNISISPESHPMISVSKTYTSAKTFIEWYKQNEI